MPGTSGTATSQDDASPSSNEHPAHQLAAPSVTNDDTARLQQDDTGALPSMPELELWHSRATVRHETLDVSQASSRSGEPQGARRREESYDSNSRRTASTSPTSVAAGDGGIATTKATTSQQQSIVGDITAKLWEAFVRRNERVRRLRIRASDRRKAAADHRRTLKHRLLKRTRRNSFDPPTSNESDGDSVLDPLGVAELFEALEKNDEEVDRAEEQLATEEDKLISVAPQMGRPSAQRAFATMHKPDLDYRGDDSSSEVGIDMDVDQNLDPEAAVTNAIRLEEGRLEDEILDLRQERNRIMLEIIGSPEEQSGLQDASFTRLDEIDTRETHAKERLADISAERERILDEKIDQEMLSPWVVSLNTTPLASPDISAQPSSSPHRPQPLGPPMLELD